MTKGQASAMAGCITLVISALLLLATPFVSAAIVVAALAGAAGAILVFALGDRRLALAVAGFSVLPLVGLALVEAVYRPASNGYLLFAPVLAVVILVLCGGRILPARPRA
jgi:hypothetical protein